MIIGILIQAVIMGLIADNIAKNKGYDGGFWWGFFFSLIGVIVVASRTDKKLLEHPVYSETKSATPAPAPKSEPEKILVNTIQNTNSEVDINDILPIKSYQILTDENTQKPYLRIRILNNTDKTITAMKITAQGYNSFHEPVIVDGNAAYELLVQDIKLLPEEEKQLGNRILLPDSNIRILRLRVSQYVDSTGTVNALLPPKMVKAYQNPLPDKYSILAVEEFHNAKYYMADEADYWQCTCGAVNTGQRCLSCRLTKVAAGHFSPDEIENFYNKKLAAINQEKQRIEQENEFRRQEELKAAEEQRARDEKIHKRRMIIGTISTAIIIILIASSLIYALFIEPYNHYQNGIKALNNHDFYTANLQFDQSNKSSEEIDKLFYDKGTELLRQERWAEATDCFQYASFYDEEIQTLKRETSDPDIINMIINSLREGNIVQAQEYIGYLSEPNVLYKHQDKFEDLIITLIEEKDTKTLSLVRQIYSDEISVDCKKDIMRLLSNMIKEGELWAAQGILVVCDISNADPDVQSLIYDQAVVYLDEQDGEQYENYFSAIRDDSYKKDLSDKCYDMVKQSFNDKDIETVKAFIQTLDYNEHDILNEIIPVIRIYNNICEGTHYGLSVEEYVYYITPQNLKFVSYLPVDLQDGIERMGKRLAQIKGCYKNGNDYYNIKDNNVSHGNKDRAVGDTLFYQFSTDKWFSKYRDNREVVFAGNTMTTPGGEVYTRIPSSQIPVALK